MTGILSLGAALPKNILTNAQLENMIDTSDEWIVSRTGISSRHILNTDTESATALASAAARIILSGANTEPSGLGGIICATIGGDTITPSLACSVMSEIGASCPAFDINAACSGYIYALEVACRMYTDKPILVIGCDILSRFTDWQDRSSCVLFGDAAGGCLIGSGGAEVISTYLTASTDNDRALWVPGTNYKRGGEYAQSCIIMNGRAVYRFATQTLTDCVVKVADMAGISVSDIDWIIPHQANMRITQAAANRLKLPPERFFMNIDHVGNTSSASVPTAFYELFKSGALKSGDNIVIASFGGGWTAGAAYIKWG